MQNAKDCVNQSASSVQAAISSLNQALSSVEKDSNKQIIQSAISSLNSTSQNLSNYQD